MRAWPLLALIPIVAGCSSAAAEETEPQPKPIPTAIEGTWISASNTVIHILEGGRYSFGTTDGEYEIGQIDRVKNNLTLNPTKGKPRKGAYSYGFGTAVLAFGDPAVPGNLFNQVKAPSIVHAEVTDAEQPFVGRYLPASNEDHELAPFTSLTLRQDGSFTLLCGAKAEGTWKLKDNRLVLQTPNSKFALIPNESQLAPDPKAPIPKNLHWAGKFRKEN